MNKQMELQSIQLHKPKTSTALLQSINKSTVLVKNTPACVYHSQCVACMHEEHFKLINSNIDRRLHFRVLKGSKDKNGN